MLCCPSFWSQKSKVHPSVPVTPVESGSKTPTEMPGTSEKSTEKKKDGAQRTSKWCFWRKSKVQTSVPVTPAESSSKTPTETPGTSEKSEKKDGAQRTSKWCFWRKSKVQASVPVTPAESSSKTPTETPGTSEKSEKKDGAQRTSKWCFWRKSKVQPSVPVTPAESSSKTPTETPGTSEKSTEKKKDGAQRTSKWCFWRKSKVQPSVPVTPAESGSKTPTETPGTSEKSTEKKDGAQRTSKWCFWRKKNKVQPASFTEGSSETPKETPQTVFLKLLAGANPGQFSKTNKKTSTSRNEKSAERKQVSVKPASKLPGKKCTQGKEAGVKINLPSSMRITAMKEERKKTTQYGQEKKPTERKEMTSNRLNMKKAETKQVSVSPTSKLPGTKCIEVKEAHVRTTAIRKENEERKTTTLSGQEKKTAERKETTSNRLNMKTAKTKPVTVSPISKHPSMKRIEVKEAHVRTNLQSPVGTTAMRKEKEERKEMTLHGQDRKEERKAMTLFKSEDEMAKFMEILMELAFSSYMEYKKRLTDPHAFSSKKMIPEGNIKNPNPTPSEGNIKSPIPTPSEGNIKSPIPTPSEGNIKSPIPTPSEGNIKSSNPTPSEGNINSTTLTQTLPPITDTQQFTGGLPNFGNSCYVNASLQCLFTAESFCGELAYLLDNSVHKLEDTFLRCFVELSRLRKSSEVQGDISKDSLLLALIESATDINPEFTINEQNDAHEFLCHCLTQMEESGRWLGWQEDLDPRCPVKANFKFKMRNIITCSSCGFQQNNKVEVFNHISLPLVHDSVDQCLYDIVNNPKVLESKCKVCGGECANSRWTFHTLPRFLILQLNRFKVTEYYTVVKLDIPLEIKPELQINCLAQSDTSGIENSKAEARETDRNELGGSTATYRLISVLSHVGSTTLCGHYLSDCSSSSQQWMTYNDKLVTLTTETDVLKMRSSSAYVLLYERVSTS